MLIEAADVAVNAAGRFDFGRWCVPGSPEVFEIGMHTNVHARRGHPDRQTRQSCRHAVLVAPRMTQRRQQENGGQSRWLCRRVPRVSCPLTVIKDRAVMISPTGRSSYLIAEK